MPVFSPVEIAKTQVVHGPGLCRPWRGARWPTCSHIPLFRRHNHAGRHDRRRLAADCRTYGFFTGAVLALQTSNTLEQFGSLSLTGHLVSFSMVRELGPVLTGLMVAGRNASGMASELGSMKVTEQIDAMRAMGVDPTKKLVTPRVIACTVMLFFLSIISDLVGLAGGWVISYAMLGLDSNQYWSTAYQSLKFGDVFMGLSKPVMFGFIIASVGCFYGLSAKGGTQGVGRATTQAMVAESVLIVVSDLFITKLLMGLFP